MGMYILCVPMHAVALDPFMRSDKFLKCELHFLFLVEILNLALRLTKLLVLKHYFCGKSKSGIKFDVSLNLLELVSSVSGLDFSCLKL